MIIISRALVLAPPNPTYDPDNPVIGWHNIATAERIAVDEEDAAYPGVNLANPDTSQEWRAETIGEHTITIQPDDVDGQSYVGLARHNLGSASIAILVQGRTEEAGTLTDLVPEYMPADDSPLMFLFGSASYYEIVITLASGSAAPRCGVLFVGRALVMERGLWVGHTPLKYGRRVSAFDGGSQSGEYLGSIVLGEYRETSARFDLISRAFYRASIEPFLYNASSLRLPFFWNDRPSTYPDQSGFARLINDPSPVPTDPSHLDEIEFQLRGIT